MTYNIPLINIFGIRHGGGAYAGPSCYFCRDGVRVHLRIMVAYDLFPENH